MITTEHMAMYVVKSIVIQINGQVYGSISCKPSVRMRMSDQVYVFMQTH